MRTLTLLPVLLVAACHTSGKAPVMPDTNGEPLAQATNGWRITLLDEWGRELPAYGSGPTAWFEGVQGQRYKVRVQNQTAQRIEAVVTVDGRDVISGKLGNFSEQRGYVIDGYGHVEIEGFRTSRDQVATFRFTSPGDSYSGRMGSAEHIGVIGVAVFTEAAPQVAFRAAEESRVDDRASAPKSGVGMDSAEGEATQAPAAPRRSNIGTQYGEQRHSSVVDVSFTRSSDKPAAVLAVYYDDRQGLIDRGIVPQPIQSRVAPQPFPNSQFAPPPPGY